MTLPAGERTHITVATTTVQQNKHDGGARPVFVVVRKGRPAIYAKAVRINGPSELKHDAVKGMNGATAWLETDSEIELLS